MFVGLFFVFNFIFQAQKVAKAHFRDETERPLQNVGTAVTPPELNTSQVPQMMRGLAARLTAAFLTSASWAAKRLWVFMPWSSCTSRA